MNTYEIEGKLAKKADDWQFHGLQQEVNRLERDLRESNRKIGELEASNSNYYRVIFTICEKLSEKEGFEDFYEIPRNYL